MQHSAKRLPLIIGASAITAALAFGGGLAAQAHSTRSNTYASSVDKQTKEVASEDAFTPKDGNAITNVNVLEDQIAHYYGSAKASYPGIGDVTVPSSTSPYAKQMKTIVSGAEKYLATAAKKKSSKSAGATAKSSAKPALVFDVDDTLVNTYDYEIAAQYGYDPTVNAEWVNAGAFPAVPSMPGLISWAKKHGFTEFFVTGRPETQRAATLANLKADGYGTIPSDRLFLKPATPPSYLSCGSTCTTDQYKSQTRAHIASLGYTVVADFGDQYSDLSGGNHGKQYKLPDPMYYLP